MSLKLPHAPPPTEDQVFKCLKLWGTFLIQTTTDDILEQIGFLVKIFFSEARFQVVLDAVPQTGI